MYKMVLSVAPGKCPDVRAKVAPGNARAIVEMQSGTVNGAGKPSGMTCLARWEVPFRVPPGQGQVARGNKEGGVRSAY